MPRPYKPNPSVRVMFGKCPYPGDEGVVPSTIHYWENPPDPTKGLTIEQRRRGKWYFKRLKPSDQVSQAQAAAILGVSHMQLNRWVRAGDIPDSDVLGVSRILVSDLTAFAKRKGRDTTLLGRLLGHHHKRG